MCVFVYVCVLGVDGIGDDEAIELKEGSKKGGEEERCLCVCVWGE